MSPFSTAYFVGDVSLWVVGRRTCLLLPAALVFLSKGERLQPCLDSECLSWWLNLFEDGAGFPLVVGGTSYLFQGSNETTWTAIFY